MAFVGGAFTPIKIVGVKATANALLKVGARVIPAAEQALRTEAELIRTASMKQTPVDLGTLRASHIVKSDTTGLGPEASIGVGGPAAPYAITVHETHRTKAKFLENAANAAAEGMQQRIGARIASSVRGGL